MNSPSIQRLLSMSQQYNVNSAGNEEAVGVILWCRTYDKRTRSFNPYVCLGRVSYVSHDAESHPVSFVLALNDYDGLLVEEGTQFLNLLKIRNG